MTTGEGAEAAAVPRVVSILSALLQRVAERNDAAAAAPPPAAAAGPPVLSAFQGLTKPAISIGGYLERIFRFAGCSPSCYVVAYIYLDRFLRRRPALAVDSFNVHRLLITSVLTAVKFVDDMCVLYSCSALPASIIHLLINGKFYRQKKNTVDFQVEFRSPFHSKIRKWKIKTYSISAQLRFIKLNSAQVLASEFKKQIVLKTFFFTCNTSNYSVSFYLSLDTATNKKKRKEYIKT
jgi:hypothetical protein|uniref:Cyclin n=1 Tax=Zea mays TaxID=4577 RepID=C4JBD9_MAIZE|nr:unknown [Zea mays]